MSLTENIVGIVTAWVVVFGGIFCAEYDLFPKFFTVVDRFLNRPIAVLVLLFSCLLFLFGKALHPDYVVFSNDGPLGVLMNSQNDMPGAMYAIWGDSNWIGSPEISWGGMLTTASFRSVLTYPSIIVLFSVVTSVAGLRSIIRKDWRMLFMWWTVVLMAAIAIPLTLLATGVIAPDDPLFAMPFCAAFFFPVNITIAGLLGAYD